MKSIYHFVKGIGVFAVLSAGLVILVVLATYESVSELGKGDDRE